MESFKTLTLITFFLITASVEAHETNEIAITEVVCEKSEHTSQERSDGVYLVPTQVDNFTVIIQRLFPSNKRLLTYIRGGNFAEKISTEVIFNENLDSDILYKVDGDSSLTVKNTCCIEDKDSYLELSNGNKYNHVKCTLYIEPPRGH